jgi:hypothetical protein
MAIWAGLNAALTVQKGREYYLPSLDEFFTTPSRAKAILDLKERPENGG